MKRILFAALMLAASTAHADRTWRTADTVREVAWQAINVIDMRTTMDISKQNAAGGRWVTNADGERVQVLYEEMNPLIGEHPSRERVIRKMALGAVAHAAVSYALPHGWRDAWQYVTIGTSGWCVQNNLAIGLQVNF